MKLVGLFTEFLNDTVNLNQTRIDSLESNIDALQRFVRNSDWRPRIRGFQEQGSWAHDTIIKPVNGGEFDADLLVMVDPIEGWSPADYVKKLGEVFATDGTYADKVKVWDYCVTITYAGERKVDIAPCVVDREWADTFEVCNRSTDTFERSEPIAYTNWLKQQNGYSGSNSFRKVTRLLKYLRDIKTRFTCSSVLLTTLLGNQINWFDKGSDAFSDTPTTLRTVMQRLDDWLQANPIKPRVENPYLRSENFADVWTDDQYTNFRNFIHKYRGWIEEAYDAEGRAESIAAWRRVFGDEFAKGEDVTAVKDETAAAPAVRAYLQESAAHLDGLVDAVRNFGLSILPPWFNRPKHMREPTWQKAPNISTNVQVFAIWKPSRNAAQETPLRAGDILPARGGLWFDVRVNGGQPIPDGYAVHWRITNTGAAALSRNAGRGDFYAPTSGCRRWEDLAYRGVHIAEAFIVRMSDDVLVGHSPPFHVAIE